MLRLVDIAGSIRLRPYNALAFCASMAAFVFVLLMKPIPQFGVLVRSLVVSDP